MLDWISFFALRSELSSTSTERRLLVLKLVVIGVAKYVVD
jgi:hypothetical protein